MTGVAEALEPVVAAETAGEAVRTLNQLTLAPPSPGTPGWEDVTDLYRILVELRVLVDRLPQVFDQIARHLQREGARGACRSDSATQRTPLSLVAEAGDGLTLLGGQGRVLGDHLAVVQSAVSHLAPVADDGCGQPVSSSRKHGSRTRWEPSL